MPGTEDFWLKMFQTGFAAAMCFYLITQQQRVLQDICSELRELVEVVKGRRYYDNELRELGHAGVPLDSRVGEIATKQADGEGGERA